MSENKQNEAWYGKLPPTWRAQRIKTIFRLKDVRSYLPLEEVNLISVYSKIGVMQHSDIEHTTGNKARNADGYKVVNKGDIIVNILLCWMGAIGCSEYDGVTSPAYDVYTPREDIKSKYYHYLFRLPAFSGECYKVGKGIMSMRWRTYSPQFTNLVVPVPPYPEQDQIVRFLDWKVSGINKLIGQYRSEIKAIIELRARITDDATIKGLHNAECIHNADIRWDINYPAHWDAQRMRESFSFRKGLSITKANLEENGVSVISYGQVHSKKNSGIGICDELFRFVNPSYLDIGASALVQRNDFIFADTSEDVAGCGNCVFIDKDDTIFAGYHTVIAHPELSGNIKYLAYLFQSPTWRFQIRKKVNAVKVYSITQKILKDVFILLPPPDEQDEIVKYLDDRYRSIDSFIAKIEEKVRQLIDMKTALIADVITGKIDVRGIEIPEYEFVEETVDTENDESMEGMESETYEE